MVIFKEKRDFHVEFGWDKRGKGGLGGFVKRGVSVWEFFLSVFEALSRGEIFDMFGFRTLGKDQGRKGIN